MAETWFGSNDLLAQAAMAAQSEVDRSARMADTAADVPETADLLQDAAMLLSEMTNPGHFNRVAAGFARGMMESPYSGNREVGASMAASMGADNQAIKEKIGVMGQLEMLQSEMIDRKRRKLELQDLPDKIKREKDQAAATLEATKAGTAGTQVRTEGEKISNLLNQSSYLAQEEKRRYLPEALRMEQSMDRAKLRTAEAEADLREAELKNAPDLFDMQKKLSNARIAEIEAQAAANQAHGRYYAQMSMKEAAEIERIKTQMPADIYKSIKEDYQYSANQYKAIIEAQGNLLTRKQKLYASNALIDATPPDKMSATAKAIAKDKNNQELQRIETDMRATDAVKTQIWNNRERFRNEVLAPYFGGAGYTPYGTNKYKPGPASGQPSFPEGGAYQPPAGIPPMVQGEPQGDGAVAVPRQDPLGIY